MGTSVFRDPEEMMDLRLKTALHDGRASLPDIWRRIIKLPPSLPGARTVACGVTNLHLPLEHNQLSEARVEPVWSRRHLARGCRAGEGRLMSVVEELSLTAVCFASLATHHMGRPDGASQPVIVGNEHV